jgi:hypothetical protein
MTGDVADVATLCPDAIEACLEEDAAGTACGPIRIENRAQLEVATVSRSDGDRQVGCHQANVLL